MPSEKSVTVTHLIWLHLWICFSFCLLFHLITFSFFFFCCFKLYDWIIICCYVSSFRTANKKLNAEMTVKMIEIGALYTYNVNEYWKSNYDGLNAVCSIDFDHISIHWHTVYSKNDRELIRIVVNIIIYEYFFCSYFAWCCHVNCRLCTEISLEFFLHSHSCIVMGTLSLLRYIFFESNFVGKKDMKAFDELKRRRLFEWERNKLQKEYITIMKQFK